MSELETMETEVETAPKQTMIKKFKEAEGKDVAEDYFLFSCLQAEQLIKSQGDDDEGSWPGLTDVTKDSKAATLLCEIATWHVKELSEFSDQAVDYSVVNIYADLAVKTANDFVRALAKAEIKAPKVERGKDLPAFWSEIESEVKSKLPTNVAARLMRFLSWSFGEIELPNPAHMPPVGRYAPRMPRPSRPGSGQSGPRRGGPDNKSGGPRRGGPDNKSGGPRDSGPRDNGPRSGGQQGSGRQNRDRPAGGDRGKPRVDKNAEASLLKEILGAIKTLKSDGLKEMALRPQNSYNRRLQHQLISSEGFDSTSHGEGHDRHVAVIKKG